MLKKNNRYDLKNNYQVTLQFGLIAILLFSIGAVKLHFPSGTSTQKINLTPEKATLILPPATKKIKTPPSPALPVIPAKIPNDSPFDPPPIDFGDGSDFNNPEPLPPADDEIQEEEALDAAEFMPKMIGGTSSFYNEIKYPESAKKFGINGMVVVEFIVNILGEVENPVIVRGIGGGCDEEVLRAIKLQKFSPGVQNGKLVKVKMRQAIHFRLH